MQVVITPLGAVDLIGTDEFTTFSVSRGTLTNNDAQRALESAGAAYGEPADGRVFISVEWLRAHGNAADSEWNTKLDDMVRYAHGRGWTSADLHGVRAHLA